MSEHADSIGYAVAYIGQGSGAINEIHGPYWDAEEATFEAAVMTADARRHGRMDHYIPVGMWPLSEEDR